MGPVYLISGPMAAGKSTVARLLAARFERGVHLEGDVFRRSIVGGREEMTPDASPAALDQLRLRYRLAAAAADTYAEAGFAVALEDVVAGPLLGEVRTLIRTRPCHVVVLFPSRDEVAARAAARDDHGYHEWSVDELYDVFARSTPRTGIWLDTTGRSPEETVDAILEATALPRSPLVVVDYDESWPLQFEEIARSIRAAVPDARVEHVGSTAVPGLAAKPVIDVDVVVASAEQVPEAIERLRSLGYVHQGDKGIPGREAFMWPRGARPHHVYVVVEGGEPLADHVDFRDHLRRNPAAAGEYAALKRRLAQLHADDALAYGEAKTELVTRILAEARSL